jgi:hypothetical protein
LHNALSAVLEAYTVEKMLQSQPGSKQDKHSKQAENSQQHTSTQSYNSNTPPSNGKATPEVNLAPDLEEDLRLLVQQLCRASVAYPSSQETTIGRMRIEVSAKYEQQL